MPSAFAHAVIPVATALGLGKKTISYRLMFLAIVCAILPDLDVIGFHFGVPYSAQWGHRGFTHSIFFAALMALIATSFSRQLKSHVIAVWLMVFLSTVSHPLLDMLTNGGLGVALYWPFTNERMFFDYRPVAVSPLSISQFFTEKAWLVIRSELIWIALPSIIWFLVLRGLRRK